MALAKVNSSEQHTAAVSSFLTTLGFVPTAGNLLVLFVGANSGSSTSRSLSVSGWTKLGELFEASGAQGGSAAIFAKVSAGNENTSPPTIVSTGGTLTMDIIFEEWPGAAGGAVDTIDTNVLPATPSPVAVYDGYTTGATAAAMNSNTLSLPTSDCLVLTVYGGRGTTTQPAPTWSGGAVASTGAGSGTTGFCFTASQRNTSGSNVTHVATSSNSQGNPAEVVGSVAFNVGVPTGGGGGSSTETMNGFGLPI